MIPARDETITLVGAGLVGSLLSLHLVKLGYRVEILERRPDMRREKISAGRSINLALSTRGLTALHAVDLRADILKHAVPMRGRLMHSPKGELTFQPYGRDDSEFINSVSRGGLNALLMTRAEETGRVTIRFNSRVTGINLETGELQITDERYGTTHARIAQRVIGTDGSASAIRAALLEQSGSTCTPETLDYGYKELTIPPGKHGEFAIEKNALHIWPRGAYMTIALPNEDGSFTCTLFLPYQGAPSFETLTNPEAVHGFFTTQFPDLLPLVPHLEESFFANPTGAMVTVKSSRWHYRDRVLLLGDAAHAIVPFFGQGMNCGFEDCTVLSELLSETDGDWSRVMPEFFVRRKPNTDAIADLAVENFVEMRDRVADPRFLLEKEVEKKLMLEFPGEYVSRYGIVTFSNTPYEVARQAGLIQSEILSEICRGIARAEEVDLPQAGRLIRQKLAPYLLPRYVPAQTAKT